MDEDGKLTHFKHNKVAENTINHNNVRHVTQANDSLLYIGTYAGLQTLNLFTGEFTDYEYDLNVEAADIRSIISMHYDTSGTLWLATFYKGIKYYNVALVYGCWRSFEFLYYQFHCRRPFRTDLVCK